MTDTTQYDPSWDKDVVNMTDTELRNAVGELRVEIVRRGCVESQLRERVVAQQARIVELHYYLSRAITTFRTIPKTVEKRARKVLATTDDLSALAEHDKQLWNEALTTGIEWQATRGHTLDADDYGNELRSLKR